MEKKLIKAERKELKEKKPTITKANKLTADVYDIEGKKIEGITLDERIFNVIVSARLMAQYVRVYNDRTHQGTRETKTRADVIGSTVKFFDKKEQEERVMVVKRPLSLLEVV